MLATHCKHVLARLKSYLIDAGKESLELHDLTTFVGATKLCLEWTPQCVDRAESISTFHT